MIITSIFHFITPPEGGACLQMRGVGNVSAVRVTVENDDVVILHGSSPNLHYVTAQRPTSENQQP
jgi:hypothetical protein